MSKAEKWIETEHRYIPYELPEGASVYESDMDTEVACCCCGRKLKFGDCYTSRHIHTETGFGYAECETCYYGDHESEAEK